MRTTDETKIQRIKDAVIDLVYTDGLSNLTTAKIAKQAGVSPATIYLHYKDKTDLLSRVYEEVKTELHVGLDTIISPQRPIVEQIRDVVQFTINQYLQKPKKANFMNVMWSNAEQLDEHAIDYTHSMKESLVDLYEQIWHDPNYMDVSVDVLDSLFNVPANLIARTGTISTVDAEDISIMINKAILV
ncbi:TetR/AcrR family transcriptional regulator [Agrilactobacillus yilanensis]|uniref:TetR/AcrR family transcriptional regulator n=1 Tax=Agrilactobacillus yilanensis TaxID=2485997 RepID=A0ABW4J4M3_9LACO|nr:TetR/AcrR family transcriptional regulator [Agrilactobacillus yilanensis]